MTNKHPRLRSVESWSPNSTTGPGKASIAVYSFTRGQVIDTVANIFIKHVANGQRHFEHSLDELATDPSQRHHHRAHQCLNDYRKWRLLQQIKARGNHHRQHHHRHRHHRHHHYHSLWETLTITATTVTTTTAIAITCTGTTCIAPSTTATTTAYRRDFYSSDYSRAEGSYISFITTTTRPATAISVSRFSFVSC